MSKIDLTKSINGSIYKTLMVGKERVSQNYQKIAGKAAVFDTETGMGDKSVVKGIKASGRRAAKIVLSQNPTDVEALALLKWTKDKKSNVPKIDEWMKTFGKAGLLTFDF
jgi:hypothetical protein